MGRRVLIQKPIQPTAEKLLVENGCEIVRGSGIDKTALMQDIETCDAIVVKKAMGYRFDREVIDHAERLKIMARFGVGMEIIDVDYAQSKGIIVTNSPRSNSNAVAEHTMYLILACAKNAPLLLERMRSGLFNGGSPSYALELEGATLGVIGCGRIGSMVAQKAKYGFGMRVIGYDPFLSDNCFPADIERSTTMEQILKESDIVTLHMNVVPETVHLLNAEKLALMKPSAFLINAARGEIIDQHALYEVLYNRKIAGAGLDVFETEPLAADDPLLSLDNVVLTPHYAAFTRGALEKASMDVANDILAVLNGEVPTWEVTKLGRSPKL